MVKNEMREKKDERVGREGMKEGEKDSKRRWRYGRMRKVVAVMKER